MKVLFIAGFGPVVRDSVQSRRLYVETLGIEFIEEESGYLHTGKMDGSRAFALWPLEHAARSCFGSDDWPAGLQIPGSWIEFDVDDMDPQRKRWRRKATHCLSGAGRSRGAR